MIQIQLGTPPPYVQTWIKEHATPTSVWRQYVSNLENFQDSMIGNELPAVGSDIDVNYKIDTTADFVPTKFQVLGYNGSIPQFIKYKNGSETIYVPSTVSEGGELAVVAAQSEGETHQGGSGVAYSTVAYTDKSFTSDVKGTITAVDGTFTYGSTNFVWGTTATTNGGFSVPMTVTVGGTSYTFAGYNMTIMSRYGLRTSVDGTAYNRIYFSKNGSSPKNRWTTSEIRSWMNSSGANTGATWKPESGSTESTSVPGLLDRFDSEMLGAISKAVNRTYVYNSFVLDHAVDMFWLLGNGNVNYNLKQLKDYANDTSIFSGVFDENTQTSSKRIRYYMGDTGGSSGTAGGWWLRSALYFIFDNRVGYVSSGGIVDHNVAGSGKYAVLPVCLIG